MFDNLTKISYRFVEAYPEDKTYYNYENLQDEDNTHIYERENINAVELKLTFEYDTCNVRFIQIHIVEALKVTIKLYRENQDKKKVEVQTYKKQVSVGEKKYPFNFSLNESNQCEIYIPKNNKIRIKSIVLKSQQASANPNLKQQIVQQQPGVPITAHDPIQHLNTQNKSHQNLFAKPTDVQVNLIRGPQANNNSRFNQMVENAKKTYEQQGKMQQTQYIESQRQKQQINKKHHLTTRRQKQEIPIYDDVDEFEMFDLHPSDFDQKYLQRMGSQFTQKILDKYRALTGIRFFIDQQDLYAGELERYTKIITDNGGKVQSQVDDKTNYILVQQVVPGQITDTDEHYYLKFQFLDDLQPKQKPQFDKYTI